MHPARAGNLAETPRCYPVTNPACGSRTRQTCPTKVSSDHSDARPDVIGTGVLFFPDTRDVVNPGTDITMKPRIIAISRRQKTSGPNHHLWKNHGRWWFHGTIHLSDGTAERVRRSLRTRDLATARQRRDSILDGRPTVLAA